ncbi:hypothetical protein [Demequina iriomotensis]|uniref:hypothetical protein n=1 Tax=Demequina iriomotensis TaxID=1536641 RepID=UPI0007824DE5|nr:hypothetical protein [Demequina iriomotensis]
MGFHETLATAALWVAALAAVIALIGALARLWRVTAAFGILAALAVGASFGVQRLEQVDQIWVVGFHDRDPQFSAEVRNVPLAKDGATYVFEYGRGWDALVADLEASHPEGEVEAGSWSVVHDDGIRYRVTPSDDGDVFEGDDVYVLATDAVAIWRDASTVAFQIPFPPVGEPMSMLLSTDVTDAQQSVGGVLTEEGLADYYDALGGVTRDGDAFIVPTSRGGHARVWFVDPGSLSVAEP